MKPFCDVTRSEPRCTPPVAAGQQFGRQARRAWRRHDTGEHRALHHEAGLALEVVLRRVGHARTQALLGGVVTRRHHLVGRGRARSDQGGVEHARSHTARRGRAGRGTGHRGCAWRRGPAPPAAAARFRPCRFSGLAPHARDVDVFARRHADLDLLRCVGVDGSHQRIHLALQEVLQPAVGHDLDLLAALAVELQHHRVIGLAVGRLPGRREHALRFTADAAFVGRTRFAGGLEAVDLRRLVELVEVGEGGHAVDEGPAACIGQRAAGVGHEDDVLDARVLGQVHRGAQVDGLARLLWRTAEQPEVGTRLPVAVSREVDQQQVVARRHGDEARDGLAHGIGRHGPGFVGEAVDLEALAVQPGGHAARAGSRRTERHQPAGLVDPDDDGRLLHRRSIGIRAGAAKLRTWGWSRLRGAGGRAGSAAAQPGQQVGIGGAAEDGAVQPAAQAGGPTARARAARFLAVVPASSCRSSQARRSSGAIAEAKRCGQSPAAPSSSVSASSRPLVSALPMPSPVSGSASPAASPMRSTPACSTRLRQPPSITG
jgi:hypothetical protein